MDPKIEIRQYQQSELYRDDKTFAPVVETTAQKIKARLKASGARYWANDNIAEYIEPEERQQLIDELAVKFEDVLDALVIDIETDPNSFGTAKRLAKMYVNELMSGRFENAPDVTAFPNDDVQQRYSGMLVTRAEIKSMCSHHHQPVSGTCWIAILPSTKVIGLSKYARLAQWYARRGTLQEELTKQIADGIEYHTGSQDIAVIIQATHGCCTNRGIMANDSSTWTSILRGQFYNPSVKQEFFAMIGGNMNRFG